MGQINLLVSLKVSARDAAETIAERQIAYRTPSPEIAASLANASSRNRTRIRIGGFVDLMVGDTGAIWRAHNSEVGAEFDALFELLRQRPGREMRFLADIVGAGE